MIRKTIIQSNSDLPNAIKESTEGLAQSMKCHRVGKIIKFNAASLTVDVELLELRVGLKKVEAITTILDIPLLINGTKNKNLTFGDIVGAEVLIHFNDTDIDKWFETGEKYEPNTSRRHNISDCFAELSPRSLPNVFAYDNGAVVLNNNNTKIRMTENTSIMTNGTAFVRIDEDNSVHISNSVASINLEKGIINITNGSISMSASGSTLTINGNLIVTGTITGQTDVLSGSSNISGKSHKHTGVTTGSGTSGTPTN